MPELEWNEAKSALLNQLEDVFDELYDRLVDFPQDFKDWKAVDFIMEYKARL